MSRCLCDRSIDHVVLERGEIAHTWRTERWDSLRLLTPNWQSRLPGFSYNGDDPDGYRPVAEVIEFIASYAQAISAPVLTHTTVTSVRNTETGYVVRTDQGDWHTHLPHRSLYRVHRLSQRRSRSQVERDRHSRELALVADRQRRHRPCAPTHERGQRHRLTGRR